MNNWYRTYVSIRFLNFPSHLTRDSAISLYDFLDDEPLEVDGKYIATVEVTEESCFETLWEVFSNYGLLSLDMDLFFSFRSEYDSGIFNFPNWVCELSIKRNLKISFSYTIC
jgi:hypothetical protein